MRWLFLLAALCGTSVAQAADRSFEVGAHAGVLVVDELDQIETSWLLKPRLGIWFTEGVGLELDVGVTAGAAEVPDHGFFAVLPSLAVVGDPIPMSRNAPIRPILTVGAGLIYKSIDDAGIQGAAYANERLEGMGFFGAGFVIPVVGPLNVRTDARMLVTAAERTDLYRYPFVDFEWTAGLEVRVPLAKDTDKDKVPDKDDLCIDDPEDMDDFEDSDGCPDLDNDSDGIPDEADTCPIEAEDLDGWDDRDGCPDTDNDDDGLLDGDDTCPDEEGTAETKGCPDRDGDLVPDIEDDCPDQVGLPEHAGCPDTDADGLRDDADECPEEPGTAEAFGCPDGDGDRVPTYRDECPDEPGPKNADPMRSNGCPSRVYVAASKVEILEAVQFSSGGSTISRASYGLLDDVAKVLAAYPSIRKVQVEGHTDNTGDAAKNLTLSQARADAVRTYLVGKGIAAERLETKGFGSDKPIADNATKEGRAENRRVVFEILEQDGVPAATTAPAPKAMEPVTAPGEPAPEPEAPPAE